jgi:hypothetical protein
LKWLSTCRERFKAGDRKPCGYSNDILISTTPYNYKEPTILMSSPDYWARQFARQSFFAIWMTVRYQPMGG